MRRINLETRPAGLRFPPKCGKIWVSLPGFDGNRGISVTVISNFVFPIAGTIHACNNFRCMTEARIVELLRGEKRYVEEIAQGSGPSRC